MKKRIKYLIIFNKSLIRIIYRLIMAYTSTFKLVVENESSWVEYLNSGQKVILCTWHQQFFAGIRHFRKYGIYKPPIMISRSKDGELISQIAKLAGWAPVRGSSSKGGSMALHSIIDILKENNRLAGHIVDGPRGPAGRVKAGTIKLAHMPNTAIVPFYVSADKAWYMNSWDKFLLPKPFARVTIKFDDMIHFKPIKKNEDLEKQRQILEKKMRAGITELCKK